DPAPAAAARGTGPAGPPFVPGSQAPDAVFLLRFPQQTGDVLRAAGLSQLPTELLIAQAAKHPWFTDVRDTPVRGYDQQRNQVHRLAVQTLKIQSLPRYRQHAEFALQAGVLDVGDGNPSADPGRTELLPLQDAGPDARQRVARQMSRVGQVRQK